MKKLSWKNFIKKELTRKEANELLAFANNEIEEWEDFKEKVVKMTKS